MKTQLMSSLMDPHFVQEPREELAPPPALGLTDLWGLPHPLPRRDRLKNGEVTKGKVLEKSFLAFRERDTESHALSDNMKCREARAL